jgi:hypothetical protein
MISDRVEWPLLASACLSNAAGRRELPRGAGNGHLHLLGQAGKRGQRLTIQRPFLTVLTTPIQRPLRRLYQRLRSSVRPLVKPGVPLPVVSPYPGHYALVRSVVEGLGAVKADFNFNPVSFRQLGRVVYAPANETLRQAIGLKQRGKIDYLVAGPVNALFPEECDGILRLPEINRLIVASEWVRELFRAEAPELLSKIRICPAGVDPEYWKRSPRRCAAVRALVYWKSGAESFCEQVEAVVRTCGLEPVRIRWGEYDADVYRKMLDEAEVAVCISRFETQGLALAEAWSMDVPTIVWNPRGRAQWRGRQFQSGSSCPFLTSQTGQTWQTLDELASVLRSALRTRTAFRPREWVLSHMTDAVCSAALYRIIQEGVREVRVVR